MMMTMSLNDKLVTKHPEYKVGMQVTLVKLDQNLVPTAKFKEFRVAGFIPMTSGREDLLVMVLADDSAGDLHSFVLVQAGEFEETEFATLNGVNLFDYEFDSDATALLTAMKDAQFGSGDMLIAIAKGMSAQYEGDLLGVILPNGS